MRNKKQINIYNVVIILLIIGFVAAGVEIFKNKIDNDSAEMININRQETEKIDKLISQQIFKPEHVNFTADKKEYTFKPDDIFKNAPEGYFKDALFIGDSRTVGLRDYGSINDADYFAAEGMSVYNIYKDEIKLKKSEAVSFKTLMKNKTYGKVYIMLGINELGYNFENTADKYEKLITDIKKYQPGATIYIEANLHVSETRSREDKVFNNSRIDKFNHMLEKLARQSKTYYIDINEYFDDDNGNLAEKYTSDDTHVKGKYYKDWSEWIAQRVVVD